MKPTIDYLTDKKEYNKQSIKIADFIYTRVQDQAIKNGSVSETWIQKVFNVNYLTASWIIGRLYAENICGEYIPTAQHRKIL